MVNNSKASVGRGWSEEIMSCLICFSGNNINLMGISRSRNYELVLPNLRKMFCFVYSFFMIWVLLVNVSKCIEGIKCTAPRLEYCSCDFHPLISPLILTSMWNIRWFANTEMTPCQPTLTTVSKCRNSYFMKGAFKSYIWKGENNPLFRKYPFGTTQFHFHHSSVAFVNNVLADTNWLVIALRVKRVPIRTLFPNREI